MITIRQNLIKIILITIFWIFIIFLFLFLPSIKEYFLPKRTINILTWADMIDQDTVSRFEKKTGIKINVNYYDTHEELFSKLLITKGQGYDLVTVTDSGVQLLSKKGLFKKIDKSKLNFFANIDSRFLNQYFDPDNQYSIPINWDIFGIGINKTYFKNKPFVQSWALIFDEKFMPSKIAMVEDPYDNISIAAQYLFGTIENLDNKKLEEIKKLLIKQKPKVEAYGDLRADYFLKLNICPIVCSQSAYVYRAYKYSSENIFILPKEGGFKIIDSIAILAGSNNNFIYEFLNFLYDEKEIRNIYAKYGYLPILKDVLNSLNLKYMGGLDYILSPEKFSNLSFFKRDISLDKVSEIWVALKAS